MDLERGDAGERSGGGPDLGGEVGQRDEVVADEGGRGGEAGAGELDAVALVAGEANDDSLLLLEDLSHQCLCACERTLRRL